MEQNPVGGPSAQGIILRGVGGLYTVWDDVLGREHVLRAKGVFRREGRTPLVGDRVRCTPGEGEAHGWIDDILPRTSACLRPPVANVDQMVLVVAAAPQPDWLLTDRLLIWARRAGIAPLLCVNKADCGDDVPRRMQAQYGAAGLNVLVASARDGRGIPALRQCLAGRISCFAGQSAVGKSSLLNALFGLQLPTGALSQRTARGRHTTRHAQLLRCGDALVVDTPGFSLLELWDTLPPEELCAYYPEYEAQAAQCRFQPCLHDREPGCAVRAAVGDGRLSPDRWARYRDLLREVRAHWRERYD
ncbi:MAG: ribosome small subunit-dependent GTPase A [Oscillospiraceae bacterium]|jgi:ribosome biogenesis GTPase|nr:ribosome small subunit-dependent GTPase A [Oscillospiraceae bacterium]